MKCFSNSIELSFGFFQNTFGKIVCNWLSKMNKSNSTSCYADFYLGIPEILGLFFSFLNITIMNLSFYTIIWYERFGTNQNRTLINQFVTFACWIAIANNILLQIPEVIISFGFPLGQFFCGSSMILKNTIIMHYAANAAAISIVKYLYIFVFKNPSDKHDTFWCYFVNSVIFIHAFLSQLVLYFLPGKHLYLYYICSQTCHSKGLKIKTNFPFYIVVVVSLMVYVYVVFKIGYYRVKVLPGNVASKAQNVKSNLSNFKTLAIVFISISPLATASYFLNSAPTESLRLFPYNYLVQFHLHICPFFICLVFVVSHFMSNKKLRDVMYREINQIVYLPKFKY